MVMIQKAILVSVAKCVGFVLMIASSRLRVRWQHAVP